MAKLRANGLDIEYETFGDRGGEPVLLVMGLGSQMIAWPEQLCLRLARAGCFVVRFDNRDVGLSTKLDAAGKPSGLRFLLHHLFGLSLHAPYTLDDMAADTIGVCDALDLEAVHLVGASMGGMIAQLVAASHPHRVRTLTSIMSSSGDPDLPKARREVVKQLVRRPRSDATEDVVEHLVESFRLILSPGYPRSDEELRALVRASVERSYHPDGAVRQTAAIAASGSRAERLRAVEAPTLVIHGKADPLVPPEHGFRTALHVRGARLELFDGMGHDLPTPLVPELVAVMLRHFERAGEMPGARRAHPVPRAVG